MGESPEFYESYEASAPDSPLARAIYGYIDSSESEAGRSEFSELEERWFAEGDELESAGDDDFF